MYRSEFFRYAVKCGLMSMAKNPYQITVNGQGICVDAWKSGEEIPHGNRERADNLGNAHAQRPLDRSNNMNCEDRAPNQAGCR